MKFVFHYRQPFSKQLLLLQALSSGVILHGDEIEGVEGFTEVRDDVDGLILFGIGGKSREIYNAYIDKAKIVIFFDKGYSRGGFFRVSVNEFQPHTQLRTWTKPADRFERLGINLVPYRSGRHSPVLLDGASNKFCLWHGLGDWKAWGKAMVAQIRQYSSAPIIYRPRPSHNLPDDSLYDLMADISNVEVSFAPLEDDFARIGTVVSYGGNLGWDAVLAGIPHFAIGDSCARRLSETYWSRLSWPYVPTASARLHWCANIAYLQWTADELGSGEAWQHIRSMI